MSCNTLTLVESSLECTLDSTLIGDVWMVSRFENRTDTAVEAVYTVDMGGGKVAYELVVTMDGRRLVAVAMRNAKASVRYDDALSAGHSAYMLEQDSQSMRLSMGAVGPGKTVVVSLRYLLSDVSLDLATRHALLTFPFKNGAVSKVKVSLQPQQHAISATSPSGHELQVTDDGTVINVLQGQGDVSLSVELSGVDSLQSGLGIHEGKAAAVVSFAPKLEPRLDVAPDAEIIFLVDRSGSMGGTRMEQTKNALMTFLRSVPPGTLFNVVSFGSSFEHMFETPVELNQDTFDKANTIVKNFDANLGGTVLLGPMKAIMSAPMKAKARELIVLTDGEVSNPQDVLAEIGKRSSSLRVFALGLGAQASRELVLGMAEAGRGEAVFLDRGLEQAVSRLIRRVLCPVLSDVSYDWDGLAIAQMSEPKVIFSGQKLAVSLLLQDIPKRAHKVTLSGRVAGETQQWSTTLDPANDIQGALFHRVVVKDLCDDAATGENPLVDEAIRLGLVTKHTRLIVVDDSAQETFQPAPMVQAKVQQTAAGPRNWDRSRIDAIQRQLDDTKAIMSQNIDRVLVRGDAIEDLIYRTDDLSMQSSMFLARADHLNGFSGAGITGAISGAVSSVISSVSDWFSPKPFFSILSTEGHAAATSSDSSSVSTTALLNNNNNNNNSNVVSSPPSASRLTSLQTFSGCWQATDALANVLGFSSIDALLAGAPTGSSQEQWATALAIAALETRFSTSRDEWELLVGKARRWLLSSEPTCDAIAIIEAAKSKL